MPASRFSLEYQKIELSLQITNKITLFTLSKITAVNFRDSFMYLHPTILYDLSNTSGKIFNDT